MNTFQEMFDLKLSKLLSNQKGVLISGQNVDVGSHISGLSGVLRQESIKSTHTILNNPNIETSLIGINLGYLLASKATKCSCIFVKQADFLTLMMDDLVHTVNLLSTMDFDYSLNIFTFVVDSGFEGPQSRWDAVSSLEESCNIKVIHLHNYESLSSLKQLGEQGARIFLISQKYFKYPIYVNSGDFLLEKQTVFCLGFSIHDSTGPKLGFEKLFGNISDSNLIAVSHRHDLDLNLIKKILNEQQLVKIVDNSADSRASCLKFLDYLSSFNLPFSYELFAASDRKKYCGINEEKYQYSLMFKGNIHKAGTVYFK
jgi:hypothetical protein